MLDSIVMSNLRDVLIYVFTLFKYIVITLCLVLSVPVLLINRKGFKKIVDFIASKESKYE